MARETARIADQLYKSIHGPAWHGPSVLELLKGLTGEGAFVYPVPGAHSVWEIVLHLQTWQKAAVDAIAGIPVNVPPDVDWRQVRDFSEPAWRALLGEFTAGAEELRQAILAMPDERLTDGPVPGRKYLYYDLLHGIAQHNLYHAGQIALLRKALG